MKQDIYLYTGIDKNNWQKKQVWAKRQKSRHLTREKIIWFSYLTLILTRKSFNLNVDFRLIVKMWLIMFYPILLKKSSDLIWVEVGKFII